MDRHRNGPPISAGIVLFASLASCAFDRPLPTYDRTLDSGVGFEGHIRVDGDCVWVKSIDVDGLALNVVWPLGYRARGRPLEIIDASGAVIAREGDLVSFGISPVQHGATLGCPTRSTALATEIVEVNGTNVFVRTHSPTPFVDRPVTR